MFFRIIIAFLFLIFLSSCSEDNINSKPNIIYILADDLGYGELGCYGQEKIETPNIDALAYNGLKFTQHYSGSAVCAPSRCVLLTGQHTGHTYVRGNDEWGIRGDVWDYMKMFKDPGLEGQRPIPDSLYTMSEMLQDAGYTTACVGKWGLGAPGSEGVPNNQGFDLFYGYNCQRQAHTYYPLHLYKNNERVYLQNDSVEIHRKLADGADPMNPEAYKDFTLNEYAPDLMFDEITQFVDEQKANPFFLYWSTPIPHVALQADRKWLDYYKNKFGGEEPYLADKGYFPHQNPRAAYAAMISYLDEQVGMLVDQLKNKGIYENTIIMFTSDNGASYAGGADPVFFDSGKPFKSEDGWGKGSLHEGGIRVPMIVQWPNKIKPGQTTSHLSAFWDIYPTFCDIVGDQKSVQLDGKSFLPTLLGEDQKETHEFLYWEFPERGGSRAVRLGKWKALQVHLKKNKSTPIQLFDLESDPREQIDVAAEHQNILKQVQEIFVKQHIPSHNERWQYPFDSKL